MAVSTRLAALGSAVLIAACGTPAPAPPPPPLPVTAQVPAGLVDVVSAVDAFGLDLLTAPALAAEPNLVVSPMSVFTALRMVGAGARGETAAQIERVLHLPAGAPPELPAVDQTDVRMANTSWTRRGLTLRPDYRDTLRTRFGTTMNEADFGRDPEGARRRINETVADQTAGKITDLFPRGSLDSDTQLVLTNALYLKAPWAHAFPAARTADEPFTRADGSTVTVPMMHNHPSARPDDDLGYAAGDGYQVVTLPYRGGALAFTVIVPATPEALRGKGIATLLAEVEPAPVTLAMPRFTTRSAMDLQDTLEAAGMPLAFTDTADFTGIADVPLHLDSVRHNTFVQVDEEGTEAAAATGIEAVPISAQVDYNVVVDRPFVFVITDTATGTPLFLGRISDPTA
jgi:serine protease inhibitor